VFQARIRALADFGGDADDFRAEARSWLEANFPPALRSDSAVQLAGAMGLAPTPEAALSGRRPLA
jgi:hypothetical protein